MSFFEKFFSYKNRNKKNENALKTESDLLSFRSSNLNISRDQIRFILFRECDRRGRKLLFDSNAVEKIPLPSKGVMCNQKNQPNSERIIDFIETTTTHGYRYKKPSNDVACLGEMIFGSVAMIYKGENSYKIHSIPSPKQIMFTTIVHAPSRCPVNKTSDFSIDENSVGSSYASVTEILNQKQTSSSDSKLYRKEGVAQKYSSTYPWIKYSSPLSKINQCCEISDLEPKFTEKLFLHRDSGIGCLESLSLDNRNNQLNMCNSVHKMKSSTEKLSSDFSLHKGNNLNLCQKGFNCEKDSSGNCDALAVPSMESENVSSVSGSLSSLRRRWAQSHSASLDSMTYSEISSSPSKKKTKLGMAVLLDLSNTLEEKMEKFLFNHTIIIDNIMSKLQSSVERAYIRNENFVDLIYTAFQESQQSLSELITGGKYEMPIWYMLSGNSDDIIKSPIMEMSVCEENMKTCKKQDLLSSMQLKFLNEFCDVLVKFDTKDTNFFVSTLLTAVLTHHLSWVTSIAETDISSSNENLSVIKSVRPYNPLWAQLNDLCGLLGSPLKCAKTIVTGAEGKKSHIAAIIQVLTYFIRCYNVVENFYEVDIESVIGNADSEAKKFMENLDSDFESDGHTEVNCEKTRFNYRGTCKSPTEKFSDEDESQEEKGNPVTFLSKENKQDFCESGGGLKRSKSYLSHMKVKDSSTSKLYPDIKSIAQSENVNVDDLNYAQGDTTDFEGTFSNIETLTDKIKKMIRVPEKSVHPRLEGYLSPDEGYDTIDSSKSENICAKKVEMERQRSTNDGRKENIIFVLGENEELVNLLKKVVVTQSSVIDIESEDSKELSVTRGDVTSVRSEHLNACENKENESDRTQENLSERTCVNCGGEKVVQSRKAEEDRRNTSWIPWMVRELNMPKTPKPCRTGRLEVTSLGGVNQQYNSEQIIQGVLDPKSKWEHTLRRDLFLCAHNAILEKDISEALCIVGDMDSWEVSMLSSNTSALEAKKHSGVRVGMSQLVADMLESFLYLHTINLSPNFCLLHIERKLYEIYLKSKTVAELLNSTELCSIDDLTTRLDIGINDVPLLLSVATTHSPNICKRYGLSFT